MNWRIFFALIEGGGVIKLKTKRDITGEFNLPQPECHVVSFILVHHNAEHFLRDCVGYINGFRRDSALVEILVVDNSSTIPVNHSFPGLDVRDSVIRIDVGVGYSEAINCGIEKSRGEILFLANTDVSFEASCIDSILEGFRVDQGAQVLAPMILNADGSIQHPLYLRSVSPFRECLSLMGVERCVDFASSFFQRKGPAPHEMRAVAVRHVCGCFIATRRKTIERTGAFDSKMIFGYEDVDYCRRVEDLFGVGSVQVLPSLFITHYGGGSREIFLADTFKMMDSSFRRYFRKYYGWTSLSFLLCLRWLTSLLRFARFILPSRRSSFAQRTYSAAYHLSVVLSAEMGQRLASVIAKRRGVLR